MAIQAQLSSRQPTPGSLSERPTQGLEAGAKFVLDALSLLDHRTRARAIPAEGAPPGHYLLIDGPQGQSALVPLDRPVTHVGRGLHADVRLEDPRVSRHHAIVAPGPRGLRVLDDRSAAGTFLNGRPVMVAPLSDGDVIRFGPVAVRYVEVAPSPARARPRSRPLRRIPLSRVARRRVGSAAA